MPLTIELIPQSTTHPNDFKITFGASAIVELRTVPEAIVNKSLGVMNLDYVYATAIVISTGSDSFIVPWSNILGLKY